MFLQAEITISDMLAALVYYAFLFAGSITIGYLFLRLTRPEIRTLPKKLKTKNAFLAGACFLAIAIAVDAVLNGFENVVRVNSFTPLVASLLAGFTFVIFNLATSLKTRPLVIGVRLPRGKERVARGLAYVQEVVVKPAGAPPLVERELPEPEAPRGPSKSVHEKLEELRHAGAIRVEKPRVETPSFEKPALEKIMPTVGMAAKKPGFFARLFGGGKAKPKPTTPAGEAPVKEEAEIEVIMKELGLVQERPGGKAAGTASVPPGGERHRLYMHAREEGKTQGAGKTSEVTKEREEVGEFVKDVYTQLKADQKPGELRDKVGVHQPKKEFRERGKEVKVEEKPLSLSDLLGTEKPREAPAAAPAGGLFAELEALASGKKEEPKPEKKEGKEGEMTFVKMQAPDVGCPTCHSKNARIIFCPYCGTGLCANCATSIKTTAEAFVYTCPKCGEEITVKRKTAAAAAA
ncbi:zinc ribbon domain-containing protein [Candidatus Micrarchaeota archaeon]|nr:zinc ribbon domain-containing protein [Candidatus Micrarchaeota archaeon]